MRKLQKNVVFSMILLIILPIGIISPFIADRIKRGSETHSTPTESFIMDTNFGMAGVNADSNSTEYEVYQNLSIASTRRDFSWDKIEKTPGNMTFDLYDNFLDNMSAINISVLGLLDFDNNIVETQTNDTGTDKYIAPEDVPLFLNYVNETLNRYQHRVIAWEVWNEADYKIFWPGSQADFFYLFNETVKFINLHYPDIKLLSTSVIDIGLDFFKDMFEAGLLQQTDGIAFHAYSTYDEAIIYKIWQLQDLCRAYDYSGEIWLTETGNPTGGNYMHATTEDELGNRVIRTITLCTVLGIQNVYWYTFQSGGPQSDPENSEAYFGLVRYDESYTSGAYAYKFFQDFINGTRFSPDYIQLSGGAGRKNLFQFLYRNITTGKSVFILWYRSDMAHNEKVKITLNLHNVPGSVYSYDFVTGDMIILNTNIMRIGYTPLILVFDSLELESSVEIHVGVSSLAIILIILVAFSALITTYLILRKYKEIELHGFIEKMKKNFGSKNK